MGMYGAFATVCWLMLADVRMGSPGTLRNIMGMGLIIPYYKLEKGMRIGTYILCNRLLVMLKQIHFS
jgi:hypothetical protein